MRTAGCPFCDALEERADLSLGNAVALPDSFPVAEGHTLVVPRAHVTSIFELAKDEQEELWRLVSMVRGRLAKEFSPAGFTIGVNDGEAAGQTVGHAHIHVIPRFEGDTPDPRGGIRWVLPDKAAYWSEDE